MYTGQVRRQRHLLFPTRFHFGGFARSRRATNIRRVRGSRSK